LFLKSYSLSFPLSPFSMSIVLSLSPSHSPTLFHPSLYPISLTISISFHLVLSCSLSFDSLRHSLLSKYLSLSLSCHLSLSLFLFFQILFLTPHSLHLCIFLYFITLSPTHFFPQLSFSLFSLFFFHTLSRFHLFLTLSLTFLFSMLFNIFHNQFFSHSFSLSFLFSFLWIFLSLLSVFSNKCHFCSHSFSVSSILPHFHSLRLPLSLFLFHDSLLLFTLSL